MKYETCLSSLRSTWRVAVAALSLGVPGIASAVEAPVAVSPGDSSTIGLVEVRCPAFSWGGVEGVEGYQLVVYRLAEESDEKEPVLRRRFPKSVGSWTPSLEHCLERGVRYAWSIAAVRAGEAQEWSEPRLFAVAAGPSEAELMEALRWIRQSRGNEPVGEVVPGSGAASAEAANGHGSVARRGDGRGATSRLPAAGDSSMQVNDSPVVTVATLRGALCATTERRFIDRGDGTVLDCNTGLLWLKKPNCFGVDNWQDALDNAAGLASGSCGLTDGSVAGDWRLPTISELCSAGEVEGFCPVGNASDSLANTNFTSPALSNAAGDGKWKQDNPFIDANPLSAWSSTEFDDVEAYFLEVGTGEVIVDSKAVSFNDTWPVRSE